ncbi:MAG: discoidin domain-containing protein [Kiritimatiellaeota bacterium]|nr:discoidin domain-containing protein [Kiritimatiellota bacterium]
MKKLWLILAMVVALTVATYAVEKLTLKVVKADSEETVGEDGKAANVLDGNADTFWHTQWQDASPAHPHEIILQLDPPCKIKGLTYLPRQGDSDNGMIKGYEIYVSTDGKNYGQPVKKGEFPHSKDKQTVVFVPQSCGFVKLVALSEMGDQAWASAAELGVIQEGEKVAIKPELKVVKVDSEETSAEDGKAANAVDGKGDTIWHTQWGDNTPGQPHEITLEMNPPAKIKGLNYLPRQDDVENGRIKEYEIYLSDDGKEFGQPVAKGTFENSKDRKLVKFAAKLSRFIKLRSIAEVNNGPWASAAEIDVVPDDQ